MSGNDLETLRRLAVSVVLVAATVFFAVFVDAFYPLYWAVVLAFAASCLSLGDAILRRMFPSRIALDEHLTFALPIGVLAFELAIFCLGLVHCLNVGTFFVLPLLFFASGARPLVADLRAWWRVRADPFRVTLDVRALPVLALAGLALAFLYFQQLT